PVRHQHRSLSRSSCSTALTLPASSAPACSSLRRRPVIRSARPREAARTRPSVIIRTPSPAPQEVRVVGFVARERGGPQGGSERCGYPPLRRCRGGHVDTYRVQLDQVAV